MKKSKTKPQRTKRVVRYAVCHKDIEFPLIIPCADSKFGAIGMFIDNNSHNEDYKGASPNTFVLPDGWVIRRFYLSKK